MNSLSWHPGSRTKGHRPGRDHPAHRPARFRLGRQPVEPRPERISLRHLLGDRDRPHGSVVTPRGCRWSGPTGSSPPRRGRRSTTTCCKSRPTSPSWNAQLRVDVAVDIQQESVARAGFNGSGVLENNRILERHDSVHGTTGAPTISSHSAKPRRSPEPAADKRNISPIRSGRAASTTTSSTPAARPSSVSPTACTPISWSTPTTSGWTRPQRHRQRSQAARPRRRGRAFVHVVPLSAASCPRPIRCASYVDKNPKAFPRARRRTHQGYLRSRSEDEGLMDQDAERYPESGRDERLPHRPSETIVTMALRYEADLDLPTVAAELSLTPKEFLDRLGRSQLLARNFGSLKVEGGTVQRTSVHPSVRRHGEGIAPGHAVPVHADRPELAGQHRRGRSAGGPYQQAKAWSSLRIAGSLCSPVPTRPFASTTWTPAEKCTASSATRIRCGAWPWRPTPSPPLWQCRQHAPPLGRGGRPGNKALRRAYRIDHRGRPFARRQAPFPAATTAA